MTPPEPPTVPPLDWAAVIALVCAAAVALSVLALSIAYAIRGGPIPPALMTALGVLIGISVAYLGPRSPGQR